MIVSEYSVVGKPTRYFVDEFELWEDFGKVTSFVQRKFACEIKEKSDGPGVRVWIVVIDNVQVVFTHNDMLGTSFFSDDENSQHTLVKIINALECANSDDFSPHPKAW